MHATSSIQQLQVTTLRQEKSEVQMADTSDFLYIGPLMQKTHPVFFLNFYVSVIFRL